MKEVLYKKREGNCAACIEHSKYHEMEGDLIDPLKEGGSKVASNLQMLYKPFNRRKGAK